MIKKILASVAIVVVLIVGYAVYKSSQPPADLWSVTGTFPSCPSRPSCVSSAAIDKEHKISPLGYPLGVVDLRQKLEEAALSVPGAKMVDSSPEYLHLVYATPTMGYRDDVELLIVAGVIEVRSISRFGHSDHGVNRARIEALRKAFETRLARQ